MTETTAAPAPAEAKPNHGLSIAEAVADMVARRTSAPAPTPEPATQAAAAEESNPETGETAEATSVEGVETEAETTEAEQAEAAEETTGETMELGDDSRLILPDGSEWSAKELAEGVLRHKDYTQKTQAVAKDRQALTAERQSFEGKVKEFETEAGTYRTQLAEAVKAAQAERERYAESVAQVEQALNQQGAEWAKIDWDAEAERDPNGFARKWAKFQAYERAVAVTRAEKAELEAKRKADAEAADKQAQEAFAQAWQTQRNALGQHITQHHAELMDPERGKQQLVAMANTAEAAGMPKEVFMAALGYTPRADVPILHPAVFELLRKATLYDQANQQKAAVLASKEAPKPDATGRIKVAKVTAPRFKPPSASDAALGRAQAAFNSNPSVANAVALEQAKRAATQAKQRV